MAISIFSFSHLKLPSLSSSSLSNPPLTSTLLSFSFSKCPILSASASSIAAAASDSVRPSFNEFFSIRENDYADEEEDDRSGSGGASFSEAVELFNGGDYYKCHDVLESLWNDAEDPARTLIHGVLQCAVGFHHLFNKNHKGAMMELGEGLCKLRKMNFEGGPFLRFEQEISAVLDFIYQTQLEFAACTDDFCHALDQSEKSYQLLGGYAAGQLLYRLEIGSSGTSISRKLNMMESIEDRRLLHHHVFGGVFLKENCYSYRKVWLICVTFEYLVWKNRVGIKRVATQTLPDNVNHLPSTKRNKHQEQCLSFARTHTTFWL